MVFTRSAIKKEFRRKQLCTRYSRPAEFLRCQWQVQREVSILYFLYRWLHALFFVINFGLNAALVERSCETDAARRAKYYIFLTNWGFMTCAFQAVLAVVIVTMRFGEEKRKDATITRIETMPILYHIYWVLHTIAVVLALAISFGYWAILYKPSLEEHRLTGANLTGHLFNSIAMLIDFFLVSHPFRFLHFYWPLSFGIVYLFFSVIYHLAGGTGRGCTETGETRPYIYARLDWNSPGNAIFACIQTVSAIMMMHCLTWVLFLVRRWLYSKYKKRDSFERDAMSPEDSMLALDNV